MNIGDYSRGGKTRGHNQAQEHDMGVKEKYIPCGILDEDIGQLYLNFGSSYKTSDFIVDSLYWWWQQIPLAEPQKLDLIQIKLDNEPENSGVRTQFLNRIVDFYEMERNQAKSQSQSRDLSQRNFFNEESHGRH